MLGHGLLTGNQFFLQATPTMTQKILEKRNYERDNLTEIVHYAPSPQSSDTVLKGTTDL